MLNHEPPPLTRNHARDNARRLKEMAQKRRDEKIEQEVREAELARPFKMKQFEAVQPRFFEERAGARGAGSFCGGSPANKEFLRKAEGKMAQPKLPEGGVQSRAERRLLLGAEVPQPRPSVPRAAEAAPRPAEVDKNFVRANRDAAISGVNGGGYAGGYAGRQPDLGKQPGTGQALGAGLGKENRPGGGRRVPPSEEELVAERLKKIHGTAALRRDQGTNVPAYILERKEAMAEEQIRKEQEARERLERVPDGYRLLPEEERHETLQALNLKKKELDAAYAKLPMKIENEGQKRRQRELLDGLKEVEDALRLFSKVKVYVQL